MNIISRTCKKLYGLFYKNKSLERTQLAYTCGICIRLTEDKQIDIICELPNLENINTDQLILFSEKYAELLLFMNKGVFKNQIFDILDHHKKKTNETILTLFIDNVMSFYDLINIEYKKIKKERQSSTPMVKPISVFRTN